jgi:uncharacterized protein YbaR (Trm112 family)
MNTRCPYTKVLLTKENTITFTCNHSYDKNIFKELSIEKFTCCVFGCLKEGQKVIKRKEEDVLNNCSSNFEVDSDLIEVIATPKKQPVIFEIIDEEVEKEKKEESQNIFKFSSSNYESSSPMSETSIENFTEKTKETSEDHFVCAHCSKSYPIDGNRYACNLDVSKNCNKFICKECNSSIKDMCILKFGVCLDNIICYECYEWWIGTRDRRCRVLSTSNSDSELESEPEPEFEPDKSDEEDNSTPVTPTQLSIIYEEMLGKSKDVPIEIEDEPEEMDTRSQENSSPKKKQRMDDDYDSIEELRQNITNFLESHISSRSKETVSVSPQEVNKPKIPRAKPKCRKCGLFREGNHQKTYDSNYNVTYECINK